jgi:hypothetical protein
MIAGFFVGKIAVPPPQPITKDENNKTEIEIRNKIFMVM